jgi:hypothetical protein
MRKISSIIRKRMLDRGKTKATITDRTRPFSIVQHSIGLVLGINAKLVIVVGLNYKSLPMV